MKDCSVEGCLPGTTCPWLPLLCLCLMVLVSWDPEEAGDWVALTAQPAEANTIPPCSLLLSLQFLDSSGRFLVNSVVRIGTRHLKRETSGHSDWLVWQVYQPPLLYLARCWGSILQWQFSSVQTFAWEWGGEACFWFWLSRLLSRGKSGFGYVSF